MTRRIMITRGRLTGTGYEYDAVCMDSEAVLARGVHNPVKACEMALQPGENGNRIEFYRAGSDGCTYFIPKLGDKPPQPEALRKAASA